MWFCNFQLYGFQSFYLDPYINRFTDISVYTLVETERRAKSPFPDVFYRFTLPFPMYASVSSPFVAKPINNFSPNKTATMRNSVRAVSFMSVTSTDHKNATLTLPASLYEILKVEKTASLNEIKTAYRNLAKVYHPDAIGSSSDGRDFIEICNAYATLSDPTARAMYDISLGPRARRVRNRVHTTQRWETDQCW